MSLFVPGASGAASSGGQFGQIGEGIFNMTAGGAITAGDLVSLRDYGKVERASPTLGFAVENNQTLLSSAQGFAGPSVAVTSSSDYQYDAPCDTQAILTTGAAVKIISRASNTPQTVLEILLYDIPSARVLSRASITLLPTAAGPEMAYRVYPLSNGRFVIFYIVGNTSWRFVIGDATSGAIVLGDPVTTLFAAGLITPYSWSAKVLANGEFFFAGVTTAGSLVAQRYSQAGTQLGAFTVDAGQSYPIGSATVALCACANGDWAIVAHNGQGTIAVKGYRGTGNTVGTTVALSSSGGFTWLTSGFFNYNNYSADRSLQEAPNGKLYFQGIDSAQKARLVRYSATFAYEANYSPDEAVLGALQSQSHLTFAIAPDGTIAAFVPQNLTAALCILDANMTLAGGGFIPLALAATTGNTVRNSELAHVSNVGWAISICSVSSGVFTYFLSLVSVINNVPQSTVKAILYNYSAGSSFKAYPHVSYWKNLLFVTYLDIRETNTAGQGRLYHQSVRVVKSSIFGVAQAAAADGAAVPVATVGNFKLPADQNFGPLPTAFNHQAAAPVGNKGLLVGATASLKGIAA